MPFKFNPFTQKLDYIGTATVNILISPAVYAASTANLNATYTNGAAGVGAKLTNAGAMVAFAIDGTSPPLNSRILIKDQTAQLQNGVYTLTTVGSGAANWVLTRATNYDTPSEVNSTLVPVTNGTANANTSWLQSNTVTAIGVDSLIYTEFTANPSTFLKVANNLSDVASVPSSRTSLGLGTGDSPTFTGLSLSGLTTNGSVYIGAAGLVSTITGTTGQIYQANTGAAPTFSTATYPPTTTANQILYSSSANVVAGLGSAANGVLITSAGSVPSISSTLPSAVQDNITRLGTVTSGTWNATVIIGQYGGTGVANTGKTITLGGSLTTSGAFDSTFTMTGATGVTFPTSGTLATTSQIPSLPISLANGGTNASLTASNGGIFYSTASAGAILSGTATARQMLQSGSSTTPAWSTTTWPATTTANQILYSISTSVIGEITTANNGVLVTSAGGIPSISSTLPSAVQGNITSLGTIASGTWNGSVILGQYGGTGIANTGKTITLGGSLTTSGAFDSTFTMTATTSVTFPTSGTLATTAQLPSLPLSLANGGTNANLTASNGGVFYSTASAAAILSGTATANQMLLSGSSAAPAWSTATHPATTVVNQILYSSSTNTIAGLATANNGTLITSAGGVPSISSTLPSAVQDNITRLGTIASIGAALGVGFGGTGTTTTFTAGSVVFAGSSGVYTQDNASLFFDDTNNRLGIGTAAPVNKLDVNGAIASGTYAGVNTAPSNGLIVSGAVGIGTASPANKLDVSGAIAAGTYATIAAPTNGFIVSGNVGIGTSSVNASAALHVSSTTQGILPPVMTSTQKNAIASPATGLVVYDSTVSDLEFYNGTSWTPTTTSGMQLIASNVLGSDTATVTFSGIPATYNNLRVLCMGRCDDAANVVNIDIRLATGGGSVDTGANYDQQYGQDNNGSASAGTSIGATSFQAGVFPANNAAASHAGQLIIDIIAYAGTTFYKNVSCYGGTSPASAGQSFFKNLAGNWRNTGAITSVQLLDDAGGKFKAGSSFYLYGTN